MNQNEINQIATLVEEYVGQLSTAVQQALDNIDTRLRSVEYVAGKASYLDFIRLEAVRLGLSVHPGPGGDSVLVDREGEAGEESGDEQERGDNGRPAPWERYDAGQ